MPCRQQAQVLVLDWRSACPRIRSRGQSGRQGHGQAVLQAVDGSVVGAGAEDWPECWSKGPLSDPLSSLFSSFQCLPLQGDVRSEVFRRWCVVARSAARTTAIGVKSGTSQSYHEMDFTLRVIRGAC